MKLVTVVKKHIRRRGIRIADLCKLILPEVHDGSFTNSEMVGLGLGYERPGIVPSSSVLCQHSEKERWILQKPVQVSPT